MPGAKASATEIRRRQSEEGAALGFVLLVAALGSALTVMMLVITDIEAQGAGSYRDGAEAFYAAEAVLEVTIGDLARLPSWAVVPGGSHTAAWTEGGSQPVTPVSGPLDLVALTQRLQSESDATYSGVNSPRWRLYGHGPFSAVWPGAGPTGLVYVAAWVADDAGDGDFDPTTDSDDVLLIRAEAFGRRGARRRLEAVVARVADDVVRLVSWTEVR